MNLPMLGATDAPLMLENIPALQEEVRALARERDAVILAHNYQLPEIQDVADYVGDSLGLSQCAAGAGAETIVFCGVHFMAETASILCPDKRVLIPDPDAGCSLADTITAEQLGVEGSCLRQPDRRHVRQHEAEVKAETDYCCTSANAVRSSITSAGARSRNRDPVRPGHVPRRLCREDARLPMHVWDGECHVHAGIRPGGHLPCAPPIRAPTS